MSSNRESVYIDGLYFSSKESVDNALQQRRLDAAKLEFDSEFDDYHYNPSSPNIAKSEYYEYDSIGGEYILPPSNKSISVPLPHETPRPKKEEVRTRSLR